MEGFLIPWIILWQVCHRSLKANGRYVFDLVRWVKVTPAGSASDVGAIWYLANVHRLSHSSPAKTTKYKKVAHRLPVNATVFCCKQPLLFSPSSSVAFKKAPCSQSLSGCITTESRLTSYGRERERNQKKKKKAPHWSSAKRTCELFRVWNLCNAAALSGLSWLDGGEANSGTRFKCQCATEVEAMTSREQASDATSQHLVRCVYTCRHLTSRSHSAFFSFFPPFFFSKDTWIKCSIMRAVCSVSTY